MAIALAEAPRRDISRDQNGLEAARARGKIPGRPKVINDDKMATIKAPRAKGESVREIVRAVDVSPTSVYYALNGIGAYAMKEEDQD